MQTLTSFLVRALVSTLIIGSLSGWLRAADPDWCANLPRDGFLKFEKIEAGTNWFAVHRIRPWIYSISEPRQYEEVISYLIVGSERALLWDTGMGISKIAPVVKRLTSLPVTVLNSHTHPDHIGGNHEFEDVWGMNTKFTRENAKGYSDPELKQWVAPDHICGELPSGFNGDAYEIRPFQISRSLRDGDRIDLGGLSLEVIHTPGHTPDALCLLDRKNRLLFTGDTFYPGPLYLYSPETNFEQYAHSVDRLFDLRDQVDSLLTAHNEPQAGSVSLLALREAVRKIRSGKIRATEKDGLKEYTFEGFSILMK